MVAFLNTFIIVLILFLKYTNVYQIVLFVFISFINFALNYMDFHILLKYSFRIDFLL